MVTVTVSDEKRNYALNADAACVITRNNTKDDNGFDGTTCVLGRCNLVSIMKALAIGAARILKSLADTNIELYFLGDKFMEIFSEALAKDNTRTETIIREKKPADEQ